MRNRSFQTPSDNQNLVASTISEAYHRDLPRKLTLIESANIIPAFNNANAYSANANFGLALPVYKRLSVTFTTTDNFLNDPSAGYNNNSFQLITAAASDPSSNPRKQTHPRCVQMGPHREGEGLPGSGVESAAPAQAKLLKGFLYGTWPSAPYLYRRPCRHQPDRYRVKG